MDTRKAVLFADHTEDALWRPDLIPVHWLASILELVSKELNHLAAILLVYAGGVWILLLLFFKKKMEILLHFQSFL